MYDVSVLDFTTFDTAMIQLRDGQRCQVQSSSSNILSLALIIRFYRICRSSERLLDGWPGLRSNIKFSKPRSNLENVDARSIKDLFGRWYSDGKIGVFGESGDEEHEASSLDLHLGEVGAAGGNVGVSPTIC